MDAKPLAADALWLARIVISLLLGTLSTTIVGLWLLFAPLFVWTPSAAAIVNDTIVGALAIAFFGFLIVRYLTAYQLGHVGAIWEPFFFGGDGKNCTEFVIMSDVSRAWPTPDAGLGAAGYMIEALMGVMGTASR